MANEVSFQPDLYEGTASYYDRFRLSYPDTMLTDLSRRTRPSGRGCLRDLACGTGQLAFPLRDRFADVWAVDAEVDMTNAIRAKAAATDGAAHVRAVTAQAEELTMDAGSVELIVIGNAFHRLRRDRVAQRALSWLKPGGYLALCWSTSPWAGPLDWQQAFGSLLRKWQVASGKRRWAQQAGFRPVLSNSDRRTPTKTSSPAPGLILPTATSSLRLRPGPQAGRGRLVTDCRVLDTFTRTRKHS